MQFKRKIAVVASTMLAAFMLVTGVYGAEKKSAGKTFVPERPVTMIVPTGVGGAGDLLSRTIEKVWNKHCPQPLIIINKPGSGGVEGSLFVSRSKPDGYTMSSGYGSGWDNVAPHMMAPVQYNTFRDLIPVARITMQPVYFVVPADSPFKNMKDVVAWGKKENKPVTISTGNATAAQTLVSRAVGKAAGIEVAIVPFPGGGPAITALVGGHTMMGAAHSSELAAMVKDGRLRVLGIAAEKRDKILPNIPTLKEQGINVAASGTMKGIALPPKTPTEIIEYYANLFKTICEDPEFIKTMADMMQPVNYQGPEEFAKTNKHEYDEYGKMAKEFGLEYKKKN